MKRTDKKGFTIIEVVVVLAIAGLIFAIVFWALPNLQKSNRDNTRKNVIGNVLANLEQYSSNSASGIYPTMALTGAGSWGLFVDNYFPLTAGGLNDPLGGPYRLNTTMTVVSASTMTGWDQILYRTGYQCSTAVGALPGDIVAVAGTTRAVAVAVRLEQAVGYCVDNM